MEINHLDSQLRKTIELMPKVELHVHFEGSLSPLFLLSLAKKYEHPLRDVTETAFRELYRYSGFEDFAKVLLFGVGLLRSPEDIFLAMLQLGDQLLQDNVRYAEVTWTPQLYFGKTYSIDAVLDALNQARRKIESGGRLRIRWIPDVVRSYPKPAEAVTRWVVRNRSKNQGIVALGVGGPELNHPASNLASAISIARSAGLPINPHAGETAGASSVWEMINLACPRRIGHGVRSIEDPLLVDYLVEKGIVLEVCLSSNMALKVFPDISDHSIGRLIQRGVSVVLNTDDRALFETSLVDEYHLAIASAGISVEQIGFTLKNAVNSCYLDGDERRELAHDVLGEPA